MHSKHVRHHTQMYISPAVKHHFIPECVYKFIYINTHSSAHKYAQNAHISISIISYIGNFYYSAKRVDELRLIGLKCSHLFMYIFLSVTSFYKISVWFISTSYFTTVFLCIYTYIKPLSRYCVDYLGVKNYYFYFRIDQVSLSYQYTHSLTHSYIYIYIL